MHDETIPAPLVQRVLPPKTDPRSYAGVALKAVVGGIVVIWAITVLLR